jgi:hypothetical protein
VTGRIGEWGEGGGLDAARGDFVTRKEMIASVFCECTGLWQQLCAQEATACDGIAPKARQAAPKLVLSVFAEFDHPGVILDESSYMLPQLKRTGQKVRKTLDSKSESLGRVEERAVRPVRLERSGFRFQWR